jgi:hypothetical protein
MPMARRLVDAALAMKRFLLVGKVKAPFLDNANSLIYIGDCTKNEGFRSN